MRVKRTYHADPKNAEWTAQRDPADPRETKTILKKKKEKIPDEPLQDEAAQSTPAARPHPRDFEFNFRFNSGQCFHLLGTFLRRLPQHFQLLVCGAVPLSVMEGLPWVSPLCQILNHSALFWDDKKRLSSLANHNLSVLSWCKTYSQSIDSGHGVTFDINASVTKD